MTRPLVVEAEDFDTGYQRLLGSLLAGDTCSPRGLQTRERTDMLLWVANPRTRILAASGRRWNPFYAVGEFIWQFNAKADPAFLGEFANWWTKQEGAAWAKASCYGLKLFTASKGGQSQFESVISTLRRDPDSRRAVFTILAGEEVDLPGSAGLPCTISLQVLVRDKKLSMHATMRSCDAYRGLPYDVFFFTLLQELIATALGLELGSYTHSAASAHVYESDVERAQRCVRYSDWAPAREMRAMDSGVTPAAIASVASPVAVHHIPFLADMAAVLAVGRALDKIAFLENASFHDPMIQASIERFLQTSSSDSRSDRVEPALSG